MGVLAVPFRFVGWTLTWVQFLWKIHLPWTMLLQKGSQSKLLCEQTLLLLRAGERSKSPREKSFTKNRFWNSKPPRWTCKLHTDCPSLRKICFPIAPLFKHAGFSLPTSSSHWASQQCAAAAPAATTTCGFSTHGFLLGFRVNWNTPTMIVDPNCAILSWYTDTFMTPEPYDVQDPGLLFIRVKSEDIDIFSLVKHWQGDQTLGP